MSDESEISDEDESTGMVKQTETHDVYIMPANDGAMTDEDSGEEESVDISNLPGTQLIAFAVLYWQRQPDVYNELIADSMRRDRFDEIMKYFHAADNTKLPKKGQFIRGKPVRWGYKAWVAADPNGYVFDISVYQGKDGAKDKANASYGLGGKVVLDVLDVIVKRYPTKKLSLYFDNFFTSLKLVEEIKSMGHDATGTLRKNRIEKCPFTNPAKFMKLPRGTEEHFCDAESGIIAARWQDNGIVTIASSEYGVSPLVKAERYVTSQKKRMNAKCHPSV
ncbi:piggyBac transposable element-derived protein 3-like [Portunus trituberculatus]|uniref:piggyBac transposable element-derived protein 3-like n=1 Tax=Portunus trituberculatus TaxID=210409 RepID=UPI001E1CD78E|nr:piggyBac transposable element-derived protein 3-like [Portunus trituberculatus]